MTSYEIRQIIDKELELEPNIRNAFGLDLTKRLVVPTIQQYWDSDDKNSSDNLWTVLEENSDGDGYVIYFDEVSRRFGLGLRTKGELFDLGTHGTFRKTLYSM
jgi:hypothetical protein